jgi:heptosyltransferase-3
MTSNTHIKINPTKILIIQFKYLGDAVLLTPALQALRHEFPQSEIHLLVPMECSPIFNHLTIIDNIIGLPRKRGSINFFRLWPYIQKLRNKKFDMSIDFAGNDRGALLSFLINAKKRFANADKPLNFFQKIGYTDIFYRETFSSPWTMKHLIFLNKALKVPVPIKPNLIVIPESQMTSDAKNILKKHDIICHIGTSQPKKEWSLLYWLELYKIAKKNGYNLAFSSGINDREQSLLKQLKKMDPDIFVLPKIRNLSLFIAILNQAKIVISCDTAPLHIASGLGVKVIGLYAVDDGVKNYSKIYSEDDLVMGSKCKCIGDLSHFPLCQNNSSCMNSITVKSIYNSLVRKYKKH